MNRITIRTASFFVLCFLHFFAAGQDLPKPTPHQLAWQQMETTAFLHFTVNTFTDKEWGDGTESPAVFNPLKFDARQWIKGLKEAGFTLAIITAKHHDGFCLWPSKYTEHSVKSSLWKGGKGDVVKEVADACKEFGLRFGFYLSPWDRHEKKYGSPAYNDYYKAQLKELLTDYGAIAEVWFDGAKGEGQKDMQYDFDGYWRLVRQLQPGAVIFSDVGPDVRWVGNESGNAGETCWSTINTEGMAPGVADAAYLNTGDPAGKRWIPAETDVSIRKGWFWHKSENDSIRSPQNLVDLYYKSVGRNSLLLLNIPPNRDGLLEEKDMAAIKTFRSILNESFAINLLQGRQNKALTDKKLSTYITLNQNVSFVIHLKKEALFDRAMLQENIAVGQRIEEGKLEYWDGAAWQLIKTFTTVGYKRLLRFEKIKAGKIRLTIAKSKGLVQLAEAGVFKASEREAEAK